MANIEKLPEWSALRAIGGALRQNMQSPIAENMVRQAVDEAPTVMEKLANSERKAIIALFQQALQQMREDASDLAKTHFRLLVTTLEKIDAEKSGIVEGVGEGASWVNRQGKGAMDAINSNAATRWLGLAAIPVGVLAFLRWMFKGARGTYNLARHPVKTVRRWTGKSQRESELEEQLKAYRAAAQP